MKRFTIKQLEAYTGIREHTFRIWERRYGLVLPQRTKGNIRSYCLDEVQLLLTIALLYTRGTRISTLMRLKPQDLELRATALMDREAVQLRTIFRLIVHMFACDTDQFEATLDGYSAVTGPHDLVVKVIIPFMEKIRLLSYHDKSSEVHLVSAILRKKIILAIESLGAPTAPTRSALLFLPLKQHFDLLLLYMAYILKRKGWKVLYLGTDISIENLQSLMHVHVPDVLLTYQCSKRELDWESYSVHVRKWLPISRLLVAGSDRTSTPAASVEKHFYFADLLEQLP